MRTISAWKKTRFGSAKLRETREIVGLDAEAGDAHIVEYLFKRSDHTVKWRYRMCGLCNRESRAR